MKLATRVVLAAATALAACGGPPKTAATAPAKPASKCPNVADQLVSLMSDTAREATEEADQMRRQFAQHCEQDGWSAEAQECFLHVTTRQEAAEKCASMLTAEQGNALMQPPQRETEGPTGAAPPEAPAPTSAPSPTEAVPSPPPPAPKRAPKKPGTNTSDPCEGGE